MSTDTAENRNTAEKDEPREDGGEPTRHEDRDRRARRNDPRPREESGRRGDRRSQSGKRGSPIVKSRGFNLTYALLAILGVMVIHNLWMNALSVTSIPYSEFQRLLAEEKIAKVVISTNEIRGELKEEAREGEDGLSRFSTTRVDGDLAARLDEQLRRVAREAMDNPQMVTIDHEGQQLNVSIVIDQNRQALIDLYRRQTGSRSGTLLAALLHMASGMRREWLNAAVGYEIGKIPFNRDLNRWTPARSGAKNGS